MMSPFFFNDGNNCYAADYIYNFGSVFTVGKEIVNQCLDRIKKLANSCADL
jgi:hypothetical protein